MRSFSDKAQMVPLQEKCPPSYVKLAEIISKPRSRRTCRAAGGAAGPKSRRAPLRPCRRPHTRSTYEEKGCRKGARRSHKYHLAEILCKPLSRRTGGLTRARPHKRNLRRSLPRRVPPVRARCRLPPRPPPPPPPGGMFVRIQNRCGGRERRPRLVPRPLPALPEEGARKGRPSYPVRPRRGVGRCPDRLSTLGLHE